MKRIPTDKSRNPVQAIATPDRKTQPDGKALLKERRAHQDEVKLQNETLRQTQKALEESRDRYVDLFEFAPVGYLILSHVGQISNINVKGASLLGRTRKETIGFRFSLMIGAADRDRWDRHLMFMMEHEGAQTIDLILDRADRSSFPARIDCVRQTRSDGAQMLQLAVADITEHIEAQQILLDADRRKNEFLAMLAHELRNPLAPIRNVAQILGELPLNEPKLQWARMVIEQQVAHMSRLVDDLLDASRVARGTIVLRRESVSLNNVAQRALDMMRPLALAKEHTLTVDLPSVTVQLNADPVRITQVLANLLDNAIKYTDPGGAIELAARMVESEVRISVRHNGQGISAELLPVMFDLFAQGERSVDRQQGGLGIGLTLARKLVELHGGQLTAKSAGPECGTEFSFALPARIAAVPASMPKAAPTTTRRRVLVVDDNRLITLTMAMTLEAKGMLVKTANSGRAALDEMPIFLPEVVLLDIGMPDMDGYEVARQLRRQSEGGALCLIAVTGYGDAEARAQTRDAGFDHHLAKPVDPVRIVELIAAL